MIYLLIIASILLFSVGIVGFSAAPYVPTKRRDVKRFLLLAEIKAGERVYDLGCGDGKILTAAISCDAAAVGFELSFLNYLFCKLFRRPAEIRFANFFNADFSRADLIYMFLSQKAHNRMGEILQKRHKPGARIISYVWPISGFTPEKIDKMPGRPDLYLYRLLK